MVELENDQISVPTWLKGLENIKYRKTRNFLKNPEIFSKIIRSILGALKGPLKDQGWSWILWRYGFVSLESLGMFFVALYATYFKTIQRELYVCILSNKKHSKGL